MKIHIFCFYDFDVQHRKRFKIHRFFFSIPIYFFQVICLWSHISSFVGYVAKRLKKGSIFLRSARKRKSFLNQVTEENSTFPGTNQTFHVTYSSISYLFELKLQLHLNHISNIKKEFKSKEQLEAVLTTFTCCIFNPNHSN